MIIKHLGDEIPNPVESGGFSNFLWKNWPWVLLASFTGIAGLWTGWQMGKLRCGTLYYWDRASGAIGGAAKSVKSGISGAAEGISNTTSRARKAIGLKKKKNPKNRKKNI